MRMRHAAVMAGLALGLLSGTAKAAYVIDIYQDNNNVVAYGSGSLDLTNATYAGSSDFTSSIVPQTAAVGVGSGEIDFYKIMAIGPSSFGSGGFRFADSTSGSKVDIEGKFDEIGVPSGYTSGSLGISTSVFDGTTIAGLGLIIGTYNYSFLGTGETLDTFTVNVGVSPVPLPASAPMFGAALLTLGAVGYGVKRKKAAASA